MRRFAGNDSEHDVVSAPAPQRYWAARLVLWLVVFHRFVVVMSSPSSRRLVVVQSSFGRRRRVVV